MIDFVKLSKYGVKKVLYLDSTESTNKYAKENSNEDDSLIITGHQIAGRGRFDRVWESEKGMNATFSLVKSFKINDIHLVNFYTSYIIQRALKEFIFQTFKINQDVFRLKWPNDIMLNNKKVGGILTELVNLNESPKKFIIGIGLNINQELFPDDISQKAISLKSYFMRDFDLNEIINTIVKYFYENLLLLEQGEILMELWRLNAEIEGRNVRFRQTDKQEEIHGQIMGVQDDGGIKIKISDNINSKNICTYYTGEISFIY